MEIRRLLLVLPVIVVFSLASAASGILAQEGPPDRGAGRDERTSGPTRSKSVTYHPNQRGSLRSDDGKVELDLPSGLADEELDISYTKRDPIETRGDRFINVFELHASSVNRRQAVSKFRKPLTVKVRFSDKEVHGLIPESLHIAYLDEQARRWVRLETERDFERRTLTAQVDHFSAFGVVGTSAYALPEALLDFQTNLHSGAAKAEYPLELPPPPGGFKPDLVLRYDSAVADEMKNKRDVGSWVGVGWSLHLPRIVVNPGGYYLDKDGALSKLAWDPTAGFWRTTPDRHVKLTFDGYTRWDMWDPDGTHYQFGGTTDTVQSTSVVGVYRFDLAWMQDTNGNKLKVAYIRDMDIPGSSGVRSAYPQYVWYGNDTGTENYHITVEFFSSFDRYDPQSGNLRNDNPYTVYCGCGNSYAPAVMENKKLDAINVKVDGTLARRYVFTYSTTGAWYDTYISDVVAGHHKLSSFQRLGTDGVTAYEPISMTYEMRSIYFNNPSIWPYEGNPGNPAEISHPYLKTITNGHGGSVTYTYVERPGRPVSYKWTRHIVASKLIDPDPGTETQGTPITTTMEYSAAPDYVGTSIDQEFRGFPYVKEQAAGGTYVEHRHYTKDMQTVGHPVLGSVQRDADKLRGLEYQSQWFDSGGQLQKETFKDWNFTWINQSQGIYRVTLDNVTDIVGSTKVYATYVYDSYGNRTWEHRHGDQASSGDESSIEQAFVPNASAWIVNKPSAKRVYQGICCGSAPLLAETRYSYDGLGYGAAPTKGNLTRVDRYTGPSTFVTTTYGYDAYGNRISETAPNGATTTYTYDATYHAYLTQMTHPAVAGGTFTQQQGWNYVLGRKTSDTDMNGQVTGYEYDTFGRLTAVIRPGDTSASPTERYLYLDWGTPGLQRIRKETKTSGSTYVWTEEYFDGLGRPVQVRILDDAGQHLVSNTVAFNNRGLLANSYVPWRVAGATPAGYLAVPGGTRSTARSYDVLERLTGETAPDGAVTSHAWTGANSARMVWQETVTDPRGNKKRYTTDSWGNLAKVEELDSGGALYATTTYAYDVFGNLKQVTDNAGNVTAIAYDMLSRKTSMSDPDMGAWSYTYDANGNLATQTDARSVRLSFAYDALNRMTQKRQCTGSGTPPSCGSYTVLATYTYDDTAGGNAGKGRRTGMTDSSGSTAFVYDSRGRLTKETKTVDGVPYVTQYAYDPADRPTTITYPDGEAVTQGYNNIGLPSTLGGYVTSAAYNAPGLPTQLILGNGVRSDIGYWNLGGGGDNNTDCQPSSSTDCYGRLWELKATRTSDGAVR